MIKIKQIYNNGNLVNHPCNNCNRQTPLMLKYTFLNDGREWNKMYLCEDCSCAMANLHFNCMEDGKPFKYDMDEITELEAE